MAKPKHARRRFQTVEVPCVVDGTTFKHHAPLFCSPKCKMREARKRERASK